MSAAEQVFDSYSGDYDAALQEGLSVSGENKEYFAQGRIRWLADSLRRLGTTPRSALDFGCGTGTATPYLLSELNLERLVGTDISERSLEHARQTYGEDPRAGYVALRDLKVSEELDLAFCNGVFHHIPPEQRIPAVRSVHSTLRDGGLFAFWENNPWNPGTRYVMSRIPFDRDAITLTPPEARRLLVAGGFEIVSTTFLFIFPRALRWFRALEPSLSPLPLGAQYQVLCRKRVNQSADRPR